MFSSKNLELRLENIDKQTLRVVFNESEKIYKDLLVDDDEISIHFFVNSHLVTEVIKSINKLNSQFMWCFFENHETP